MLKEPEARLGFLDYESYAKLRDAMPDHLKPVVIMGFYTGMRQGEILKLRPEQIDFREGEIRLDETKDGERRSVPLGALSEIKESLNIQLERRRLESPIARLCFPTAAAEC